MSQLLIEPSPHIRCALTTQKIMLDVLIALLPAVIAGTWIFGLRALVLVVLCAAFCVIFEALFNVVTKKRQTVSDLSAVVTGVLLGLNLPPSLPVYMAAIGCFKFFDFCCSSDHNIAPINRPEQANFYFTADYNMLFLGKQDHQQANYNPP